MDLVVWENFSKKSNSTKRPEISSGRVVDVKIKNNTSLENPIFLIDGIDLAVNYCYFNAIGRYYFITDIILGNNNIYELHCVSDLLATYKPVIGEYTAYIERSASSYNSKFIDNAVSVEQTISSRSEATTNISFLNPQIGCYMVRVIGKDGGIASYVNVGLSSFADLFSPDIIDAFIEGDFKELGSLLFNPVNYVVGCYWLPIPYDSLSGTVEEINLKYYPTGVYGKRIGNSWTVHDLAINKPASVYTDFRASHPAFTSYSLYLPAVGVIPIASDVATKSLRCDVGIDLTNGIISYVLKADGVVLGTYNGMLFSQIQIGSTQSDLKSVIGSTVSSIGGFVSGNIPLGTASAVDAITNIAGSTPSVLGSYSSALMTKAIGNIVFTQTVKDSGAFATNVNGRPLCENRKINTLSGFIKCGNASIDVAGYASDKEAINSFLNNGFYYE